MLSQRNPWQALAPNDTRGPREEPVRWAFSRWTVGYSTPLDLAAGTRVVVDRKGEKGELVRLQGRTQRFNDKSLKYQVRLFGADGVLEELEVGMYRHQITELTEDSEPGDWYRLQIPAGLTEADARKFVGDDLGQWDYRD